MRRTRNALGTFGRPARARRAAAIVAVLAPAACLPAAEGDGPGMKQTSALFPPELTARARGNARRHPWAAKIRDGAVRAAGAWTKLSDDELWSMVFGPTIPRSWMVWSNGHCPACRQPVPMYNWRIDPLRRPWKVSCPHCGRAFPTNDFARFHRSGLDARGVFDPTRADRSLLFNAEHPDPNDPLHSFGVDDGTGFADGAKRWRFIGAYLIYGQWKQLIVGGVQRLAAAHVVTGDPAYAHKAGVLLDRLADLYPTFDFARQGFVYERRGDRGYVSTWHDACPEVEALAVAYDQVFDALRRDDALVAFLAGKARRHDLENPKSSFAHVQRNIEGRILRDTLKNRHKIESNFPATDVAVATIHTVLGWPANRRRVERMIEGIVRRATRADGLTGEKGLAGYARIGPHALAAMLERYARIDPEILPDLLRRCPDLRKTYRFHVDTWCLGRYYPLSGDTGWFAGRIERYCGVPFARQGRTGASGGAVLPPSSFSFLWRMYEHTGDPALVQVMVHANGGKLDGLPHDIFAADPAGLRKKAAAVIAREGPRPRPPSVNKTQWHLAILRSGRGRDARAVWLDYDSGCGRHSHRDGMHLGLFARGLDLLPDFGYPPVQFGGWASPRAQWYASTAAHNTVVVDDRDHQDAPGTTTLWADGQAFRAVRASGPAIVRGQQFERTAAMVDVSAGAFYVADVFRVVGGSRHARLTGGHFGTVATGGLSPGPLAKAGPNDGQTRRWRTDPDPKTPWWVDWKVEDRYGYLPAGTELHLRLTDLTAGAHVSLGEAWVVPGSFDSTRQAWVPRLRVTRSAPKPPLASTFVSVIEPYGRAPAVAGVRRLALAAADGRAYGDAHVAVEVRLADGRADLIVAADVENPLDRRPAARDRLLVQGDWGVRLNGELCLVRRAANGKVQRIALCRGRSVRVGNAAVRLKKKSDYVEVRFDSPRPAVVAGNPDDVESISPGD